MSEKDKNPQEEEPAAPDVNEFLDEELSEEEKRRLYDDSERQEPSEDGGSATQEKEEEEEFRVPEGPEHSPAQNSFEAYKQNINSILPEVEITEAERSVFEESIILNQEPFSTSVKIAGKSRDFDFRIRVRMAHEYRLIYMLVARETKEEKLPDYPAMLMRMQEFSMAVMLLSVGSNEFPTTGQLPNPWKEAEREGVDFDDSLEKAYKEILRRTTEKVDSMSQPLFVLALDAFRVFEAKCFAMTPDIMNRPFPEPGTPRSS